MCGIAGLYTFDGRPVEQGLLERMNRLIKHRGPDSEGCFVRGHVGLGMTRLKVIDLSTGDQPIHNDDKSLWIIFNGEIYNYRELRSDLEKRGHRFYTHSDTEVIVKLYEEQAERCVEPLKGMFAFAIFDEKQNQVFIARDRLGVKPLFYSKTDSGFAFASEIKPLLEVPFVSSDIDPQAVSHFFSYNYMPHTFTPFANIRQLAPGHWMKVSGSGIQVKQYWDVPLERPIDISESEAIRTITDLLHTSVQRRLIADVPIGAFLSGGMDSSTLVALMKEHHDGKIKTFSVGFDDPGYDETPFAREVAKFFGTDHHEIRVSPSDIPNLLPKIAWHADNLLADQAALALYSVSKLAKEHVTVALSGDGGDEIFIGYPTFHANQFHSIYSRFPRWIRKELVERIVNLMPASDRKIGLDYKIKKFVEAGGRKQDFAHYSWRTIFTENEKQNLFSREFLNQVPEKDGFECYEKYLNQNLDFLARSLYADLKVWLVDNNLYKVDSMTMAHGLEARVPFLDHELVEYMSRLPVGLKAKSGTLKYLLKKIMRGKLPDTVINRKKAGWHIPLSGWIKGPLKDYFSEALLKPDPLWDSVFKRDSVARLLSDHNSGRSNNSFKLWGLMVFRHWTDAFNSQINLFSPRPREAEGEGKKNLLQEKTA